ncbi:MAG: quinate 5-dehydrogenase, partial [Anaerolineales bacterium]
MKRAVSISLGSPARDKTAVVDFNGTLVEIKRIGTGGDIGKAQQLFTELDGQVDALSVGGIDLYVRIDGRDYPVRNALKLIRGVQQTPLVDGRVLKYVLERQVLALAAPLLQANGLAPLPHFRRAFMPFSVDRLGLAETLAQTAGEIVFGDLIFALGIPIPITGLARFKRVAKSLMPVMGFLPLSMLLPPGAKDESPHPKAPHLWLSADLV